MTLKLLSASEEHESCLRAWKDYGPGTWAVHLHHSVVFELTKGPIGDRLNYILKYKAPEEIPLRLRLLRPIVPMPESLPKASEAYKRAWEKWGETFRGVSNLAEQRVLSEASHVTRRTYRRLMKELHPILCPAGPDCTWNGCTIFSPGSLGLLHD